MTEPTIAAAPRPGSRAERMSHPRAIDTLKFVAERHGVCVRPIVLRRTDRETGQTDIIEVPCGATLAAKCKPCAERGRRRRIQQIREGWHLDTEPNVPVKPAGDDVLELVRLRAHLEFERSEAERAAAMDTCGRPRRGHHRSRRGDRRHRTTRAPDARIPHTETAQDPVDAAAQRHPRTAPTTGG